MEMKQVVVCAIEREREREVLRETFGKNIEWEIVDDRTHPDCFFNGSFRFRCMFIRKKT